MGRPVVHWELMSKEPAKVADFYARIFDWKVDDRPELNYRIIDTGGEGGINGGISGDQDGNTRVSVYAVADDRQAYSIRPSVWAPG